MRRGWLVCGNLSCVRHVGFNSEDARKSWNFPKGEMAETVREYANITALAARASAGSSLLLTRAVFLVLSSFSLITESSNHRLCAISTLSLVTSPSTTKTSKKNGIHFTGTIFYITESVCFSSTAHLIFSILSRARYNHVRNVLTRYGLKYSRENERVV